MKIKIRIGSPEDGSYSKQEKLAIRGEINDVLADIPIKTGVAVVFARSKLKDEVAETWFISHTIKVIGVKNNLFRDALHAALNAEVEDVLDWITAFPEEVKEQYPGE